ncbi:putative membrane protein [Halapricum desulfuricans]|uniref:Putative membrane protein n=1 Tax=Halapricum desulfuricans TaxID=2841257 RepID=A0A897NJK9_9EURY|nr:hypothetical protein [Halapricum desulfuricans]QSG12501.1 putative membrane protein [Halapricum desulfuricans]
MEVSELDALLHDSRNNAVIGWLLIALLGGTAVGIVVATGLLWSVFALGVVVLALLPPLAYRSPYVMLPWEVLLVAALPIVGLAIGSERLSGQFTVYFAIAAVALVIAVELQSFTSIRYPPWFAVVLVVVATLASAALWALLRWGFDVYVGTNYITTNDELMYEWLYSAAAGVLAGVTFTLYFRQRRKSVDAMLEEIDELQNESGQS